MVIWVINIFKVCNMLIRYTYTLQCGKESAYNAGDTGDVGLIPGSGIYPGGGNGNPLQHSCLENPIDREAWQATVHWVQRVGHN